MADTVPPHATWEQMKATTESLLNGDPHAWHLMVQELRRGRR